MLRGTGSDSVFPLPLFDRFLLHGTGEIPISLTVDLPAYLEMLVRDVESLCNTRSSLPWAAVRCGAGEAGPEQGNLPPWAYGLPDWTNQPRTAETANLLCFAVRQSLTCFEPRLSGLRVRPVEAQDSAEWGAAMPCTEGLRLRLDACLSVQKGVHLVMLLHLSENACSVHEVCYGF